MNNELILVTGASGFIGRFLIKEMLNQDRSVRCLLRRNSINSFKQNKVEIATGDLLNYPSLSESVKNVKSVVHLASAIKARKKESYYKINVVGLNNLIKACQQNKVEKIIFLSSVYANNQEGFYGQTKFLGEELVKKSGLNYTIIRPNSVFGPRGEGSLEKFIKMIKSSPIVVIPGDGEYRRQPVFISDVVWLIIACLDNPITDNKIYQIGGPQVLTLNQIIEILCQKLGKKRFKLHLPDDWLRIMSIFNPSLVGATTDKISDNHLIVKDLDFRPLPLANIFLGK